MAAVAASGNPLVYTFTCAWASFHPHTIEGQFSLHGHSPSHRVLEPRPRVRLDTGLLTLLLLLTLLFCSTTGSTSLCMSEALMLRGDVSTCSGNCGRRSTSSVSSASIVSAQRKMAFIPHSFAPRRTSSPSESPSASAACLHTSRLSSSSSGADIAAVATSTVIGKKPSSTVCSAYQLTFGKEEEPGRVALVTGASRGLGKAIAETLAEGGVSHVLCVARNQAACDEVASGLVARGYSASGHGVDVGDAAAVENLCSTLLEKYPRIDILVNNAGITRDNLFIRMTPQEWSDVINVNLNSAFYFTSPLIKRMVKNRFGRVINMSSVVGVGGNIGQANYAASKAGLIGMTRSLGKEYANRGVTVNAIAPGFIRSTMTDAMTDAAKAATIASIPAGRMGEPQDVANMVAFLASDQASYVTGKVMPVDGGMLFGGN